MSRPNPRPTLAVLRPRQRHRNLPPSITSAFLGSSSGCMARRFRAPASAWPSASESCSGMAEESGWNRSPAPGSAFVFTLPQEPQHIQREMAEFASPWAAIALRLARVSRRLRDTLNLSCLAPINPRRNPSSLLPAPAHSPGLPSHAASRCGRPWRASCSILTTSCCTFSWFKRCALNFIGRRPSPGWSVPQP